MRREEGLKDGRSVSLLFFFFHKLLRHGEEGGKQVDIFMPPTFFTRKKEKLPTSLWNLNIVHLFISVFFVLFFCRLTAGRTRSYFERSCPSEFTALWVSYGFYINYLTSVASPAIKFPCFMNLQINCFTRKAENCGGLSSPSSKSSRYCIKLIF